MRLPYSSLLLSYASLAAASSAGPLMGKRSLFAELGGLRISNCEMEAEDIVAAGRGTAYIGVGWRRVRFTSDFCSCVVRTVLRLPERMRPAGTDPALSLSLLSVSSLPSFMLAAIVLGVWDSSYGAGRLIIESLPSTGMNPSGGMTVLRRDIDGALSRAG